MPETKTSPKRSPATVWSDEERAAMREGARERKTTAKLTPEEQRAEGELEVREKLAGMPDADRVLGERIHELVLAAAPMLAPKTYYGMPAYAKNDKVIAFFKPASKFKVRYATFEFQPDAHLDDGELWPVSFAVTKLTPAVESRITALVKQAVR
jgi:uncharacterized protein YdhG (YjbR/CyaY superfamily)